MTVRYADVVRNELKDLEKLLKGLSDQWADKHRERIQKTSLLSRISTTGQRGPIQHDPAHLLGSITQLGRDIKELEKEVARAEKRLTTLKQELSAAPKRPKERSPIASIGASGSRAINEKAKQFDKASTWTTWKSNRDRGKPEDILWSAGMQAARKTAEKYGGDGNVPPEVEAIMKRALDKVLKKRKTRPR
jgi:chromosome segregation ATPase